MIFRTAAVAAVLACSAGTAGAQQELPELLTHREAPRRGCQVMNTPRSLPGIADLADSAALAATVADYARRYPIRGDSTPYALYSVEVGSGGRITAFRAIEYLMPQARNTEFTALLRDALSAEGLAPGHFRLRADISEAPRLRVGRSQRCPPVVRTRFTQQANSMRGSDVRPRPMRVRLVVAEDGRVLNVQLLGSTGSSDLDRWVQETLLRNRATPGLVDGVPQQMEIDETIQIQSRG